MNTQDVIISKDVINKLDDYELSVLRSMGHTLLVEFNHLVKHYVDNSEMPDFEDAQLSALKLLLHGSSLIASDQIKSETRH